MEFIGIDKYHKMEAGGAEKCLSAPDHGSIEPLSWQRNRDMGDP